MTVANLMEILLTLPQSDIISVDGKKIIGAKDSSCVGMSEILTKECSEEELWGLANIEKSECENNLLNRIKELENDRKNLLEKIKVIKEVLNIEEIYRLKKENADLIDKLNIQNQRLNELKKEAEELKVQIEKMK